MTPGQTAPLQLPSFLHGTYRSVRQKVKREGLRCGEQYRKDGTFPAPRQLLEVPPGEVVLTLEVADFQRERPAWRPYMVDELLFALSKPPSGEWQDPYPVREAFEARFLDTAWGALFFAMSQSAPKSAERVARHLHAVLRFWEPLQGVRYHFMRLGEAQTLEELMVASCDWAMEAWCPEGAGTVRERLELAAERMARATREDCIEAMLREMPRALAHASKLKHRQVLADPSYQRERFATLDSFFYERVSAACTSDLIWLLNNWDHELDLQ
jgi:hypothetical protein